MTTGKLIWGMTWRGGMWGLIAGAVLGAIYGPVIILVLAAISFLTRTSNEGLGSIIGLAVFAAVVGAIFGGLIGLFVGALNGLLVAVLTRLFFTSPKNQTVYRFGMAIASGLFTLVAAWLGLALVFSLLGSILDIQVLILVITLPAIIAGIAAAFVSSLLTRWYEKESAK